MLKVAICAGANDMYMWGAFLTGLVAALVYYFGSMLVERLHIDDPLDAVAGKKLVSSLKNQTVQ